MSLSSSPKRFGPRYLISAFRQIEFSMNTLADNAATVLIVNDDQMQLNHLRGLLQPEGYEILAAQDGQRALEIIRTSGIDIIISDVLLLEMNGTELWRRLKKDPHTATIPL